MNKVFQQFDKFESKTVKSKIKSKLKQTISNHIQHTTANSVGH